MGAIGGMLGLAGGAGGTGFSGPSAANIVNPTNATQINQAYTGTQNSLTAQQNLLQALQAQQGIQNQSQVYNQLQGVAAGTGPNPAQTMLNQSTGANVANQAALAAGQRGAAGNVGLIARQNAQTGAATQQNAVGQAATLEANQSLNAINAAGNVANTQASNQIGQTNATTSAQQAEQTALLNAQAGVNNANVGMQSNVNSANANLASSTMGMSGSAIGGGLQGLAAGAMFAAKGGEVPEKMADGGEMSAFSGSGPQSKFGQFLSTSSATVPGVQTDNSLAAPNTSGQKAIQEGSQTAGKQLGKYLTSSSPSAPTTVAGGPMDNMGPSVGSPDVAYAAKGGMTRDFRAGGKVVAKGPQEKAVKVGNSYANDKIPAVLSEHEIVLPREVTMSKDPVGDSARFVQAVLAKRKMRQ